MNKFASKPWYNFLNRNDGQTRDIKPLRVIGSKLECQRCFIETQITSELDTKLTTYVCKSCRLDDQEWDYAKRQDGVSITVTAMVLESPLKSYVEGEDGN